MPQDLIPFVKTRFAPRSAFEDVAWALRFDAPSLRLGDGLSTRAQRFRVRGL